MVSNKLQHFVPKCYLRNFSKKENPSAISLFRLESGHVADNAPIKGQCAKDYFYSKDRKIEEMLQFWEGAYAEAVRELEADPSSITTSLADTLLDFTILQILRTASYAQTLLDMTAQQARDLDLPATIKPKVFERINDAALMALSHFPRTRTYMKDLSYIIVHNKTKAEFIVCDDPVIHTNRFYVQKLNSDAFGIISSGAMFFLPLTPHLLFLAFDENVYVSTAKIGRVTEIWRDRDVFELNEMQVLQAHKCLYFSEAGIGERISQDFREALKRRSATRFQLNYFRKVSSDENVERYRPVSNSRLTPGQQMLTAFNHVRPRPLNWTRLLSYRLRPRVVETGTGAGWVRPGNPILRERLDHLPRSRPRRK